MKILKFYFTVKTLITIVIASNLLMGLSKLAYAEIVWEPGKTFGDIEKYEEPFYPPNEEYIESDISIPLSSNLRAFDERQNVWLTRNIKVAKLNPFYVEVEGIFANYDEHNLSDSNLLYDWDADYEQLPELSSGILVNSHFIAFRKNVIQGPIATVIATITFNEPIIGLIDSRDSDLTNDLFALTDYISPPEQTLEGLKWKWTPGRRFPAKNTDLTTRDYVKITGENNNILELRWTSTGYEGLRVLTKSSLNK